ncbi:hypothetical protein KIW84_021802 [Lathyrus oleraceus]|uniref:Uncharacterized protein n=1 Tax=Pisum sativum TaxID=3888 RepID=A0A9D5B921_PEA|nr:hypothetical protein KIW84_021802 [Pisum sativum]
MRTDAQGALDFALIMLRMEGGCPVDCNAITDLFLQALVEFFGTLPQIWALECMEHLLLVNLKGNLQITVQIANEYSKNLGVDACIEVFEKSDKDPDIHFKYIEAAVKTGHIKEVERVTRESSYHDAEKTKNFLMKTNLPNAWPLMNVCDRFGFVRQLIHYLYTENMICSIEEYVQKVNPRNAPLVIGLLLDEGCPEDFIKGLLPSVSSRFPVEQECVKRNRLCFLTRLLEYLVSERSRDVDVHNALACRYRPAVLLKHIESFSTRLNIPKLIRVCEEQRHLKDNYHANEHKATKERKEKK